MLLFGGNLSGGKKVRTAAATKASNSAALSSVTSDHGHTQAIRVGGDQAGVLTPYTDALHRLTNHELRLLEELERTRSKLQAEWRLKMARLLRQHPDALSTAWNNVREGAVPTVEELEQRFQLQMGCEGSKLPPQSDLQHAMHSKTLKLSPNQRSKSFMRHKKSHAAPGPGKIISSESLYIRTGLDMLPMLTTTGETPFEVGLEAQVVPGQVQQQRPYILPVFRLPSVNVVSTASAMAAKEIQVIKDDVDRKQASETLGLSVEEIEALEAQLNGPSTSASSSSPQSFFQPNQITLDGQKLPGLVRDNNKRRQQHLHLSHRMNIGRSVQGKKGVRIAENGGGLRKELESALYNVQHLTRLVKDDICWAQKICPSSELRTTLYFKRWGREKVENIFRRLLYNFQGVALERWKQAVVYEKQQEKLQAYLLYKGSKKLEIFLLNWSQRKLRQAWTKWWSDIVYEKALERSTLELQSIQVIQRSWRIYRGRMFVNLVRMQKLIAKQTTAAIKMQRMFRGGVARKFFKLKRLEQRRQDMATRIQALARGHIVRKLAKQMRDQRKKHLGASRVQALCRGRKARREVAFRRRTQRVTKAAVLIQRRYRGRLGRATFIRRRLDRMRDIAATKIQTMARGRCARKILANLREEERKRQAIRRAAAINIQRVYRGHRARLSTELKLLTLRERNRMYAQAATTIQNMVRKRQAFQHVERLRQERAARFVLQARTWVEYWNDEAAKWFYYNQNTGEMLWAPPATGYTKADGKLVLQDGNIIDLSEDYIASILAAQRTPHTLNGGSNGDNSEATTKENDEQEEEDDEDEDKLCVECEEDDARRQCAQCEDVFCDACYEKLHHSAKREKHTWKTIGSLRCIECEKMRATRWCSVCEDPYCLGCFTIIHSKGNKVYHQWTDMALFKKAVRKKQEMTKEQESAQTYDEYVQSSEYQYVTEYSAAEAAQEAREAQAYAQSYNQVNVMPTATTADYNGWMTLIDEASGQTYYYNLFTGESRWA